MKTATAISNQPVSSTVTLPAGYVSLQGELVLPEHASGVVLFAHGSGSSRYSPRNQLVAEVIHAAGIGTLLFDLLTLDEEAEDAVTAMLRFNIKVLAQRLVAVTRWVQKQPQTRGLKIGYFGASTGGAAALLAAAQLGDHIAAVVARGARPDLAGNALPLVRSPTLLIVGGLDGAVIAMNESAHEKLSCEKSFRVVPGATHLFEEPGKLEEVADFSAAWFAQHLGTWDDEEDAE